MTMLFLIERADNDVLSGDSRVLECFELSKAYVRAYRSNFRDKNVCENSYY